MKRDNLPKGQRTSIKILEAAGRCIAQIGAEKTSITAIAQEANLKRSLIAYHFPRKDDIFFQVMVHIMMQFGRNYLPTRPKLDNPHEALKGIIESYMDYFHDYPHYFHCYLHCYYMASVHDRYRHLNTKILRRIILRIMTHVRDLVEFEGIKTTNKQIEDFARVIYSNLLGTIMSYYTVVNQDPYDVYKERCLKILDDEIDLFITFINRKNSKN